MSDIRLLYMAGLNAEKYAERIASDKALHAAEKLAEAQAESERLNRRVVLETEQTRAQSRGGLTRAPAYHARMAASLDARLWTGQLSRVTSRMRDTP